MFYKFVNKTSFLLYTIIISIAIPAQASEAYNEAAGIYENAILSSALIKKIHEDGFERRQEESRQLKIILNSVTEDHSKDHEELHQNVIYSLEQDKIIFDTVNQQLKEKRYVPGNNGATYQLLHNRMPLITEAALKLAKERNLFFELLDGKLPNGYAIDPPIFNYAP